MISKRRKLPEVFEYSELFLQLRTWLKLLDSLDIVKNLQLIYFNRLNHELYSEPSFPAPQLYLLRHTLKTRSTYHYNLTCKFPNTVSNTIHGQWVASNFHHKSNRFSLSLGAGVFYPIGQIPKFIQTYCKIYHQRFTFAGKSCQHSCAGHRKSGLGHICCTLCWGLSQTKKETKTLKGRFSVMLFIIFQPISPCMIKIEQ